MPREPYQASLVPPRPTRRNSRRPRPRLPARSAHASDYRVIGPPPDLALPFFPSHALLPHQSL
eukprot:4690448-Pyramimonas_sp.AAC.1